MVSDWAPTVAWLLLGAFIALPALAAWHRRRVSREVSELATLLTDYAAGLRRSVPDICLDASVQLRLRRLAWQDVTSLQLAEELADAAPEVLADAAQRLALRLRRRIAFERKMLARTAPGLRRGAAVALMPPLLVLFLQAIGVELPAGTLWVLWFAELVGCLLLWNLAHVEI
jgi:hypothetical protein